MTPNLTIRSFSNDQYILDKVFYSNFYRVRAFQDTDKKPVVLDIGAHCGYFSFAALSLGAQRVYAFEPFPENYKVFLKNIGNERFAPVISYQMGIYVADIHLVFGYPPVINKAYYDFANVGPDINLDAERQAIVPCISLDTALKTYVPEAIDLLKISMGYAEMNVLIDSKLVGEKVTHICGESSLDKDTQTKFKVLMAAKGFQDSAFFPVEGEEGKVMFQMSKTKLTEMFVQK